MMNKNEVLNLVAEYEAEKRNVRYEAVYYKRNGKMVRRSYDAVIYSDRYHELMALLSSEEAKIFKCVECGEMCGWFDLETWCCDVEADEYICGCCYEDAMGEDL